MFAEVEMTLSPEEALVIETRLVNESPKAGIAYLFWFFLGVIAAHRFYLGRPVSAIIYIVSWIALIPILWWVVDGFLIPSMIRKKQDEIRTHLSADLFDEKLD